MFFVLEDSEHYPAVPSRWTSEENTFMSTLKALHSQARARRQGKPGFTLLELIVVLLVLGILAAIAVPTFNRVKENSVAGVVNTTLETAKRNAEAIAISDPDLSPGAIVVLIAEEFAGNDKVSVVANGSTLEVTSGTGSLQASGSLAYNNGVWAIGYATTGGSSGSTSSSSSSTSTTTSTTVAVTAPGAPTALLIDGQSVASDGSTVIGTAGTVTLSWTAPASTGGASITGYTVEYKLSTDSTWTSVAAATTSAPLTVTPGCIGPTTYQFRVTAQNSVGPGPTSTEIAARMYANWDCFSAE